MGLNIFKKGENVLHITNNWSCVVVMNKTYKLTGEKVVVCDVKGHGRCEFSPRSLEKTS